MSERAQQVATSPTEQAAVEWFFRRDGGFSPEQVKAFEAWLAEDPRHRMAFAEIERTWDRLGEVQPVVGPEMPPPASRARWGMRWLSVGLAAAAVIALIGWLGRTSPDGLRVEFAEQAESDLGGVRRLDLPDGSVVTLNTNSAVTLRFTAGERRVRLLRGEAHFEVAKNPARPFVVDTRGVAVRAVGTAFNVRVHAAAVDVLVAEGRVGVADADNGNSLVQAKPATAAPEASLLVAGERASIVTGRGAARVPARVTTVASDEMDRLLAWQKPRLDYADAPLAEIVADFNRYNRHKLVVADARLAERRFGGTFSAGDYASLVQLLEMTFGVVVERRERETLLRLPP